jgi:Fe-Mn family superoxide dismutase
LFSEKATKHFGSGWCWLVLRNNTLVIETTENQENPFMRASVVDNDTIKVIMALDVWEHAYYLKYQNKRADYIANWWNVANWDKAAELFNSK